jgi:hypothetical protein
MSTHHPRPAWQMPPGLPQATDETWTYILDDSGVTYGPGWWPLHADRTSPRSALSTDRTPTPCGVRLAPDVAFYAWHTEYVVLYPTDETGVIAGGCSVVPDDTPRHNAHRVPFQLRLVGDDWVAEQVCPATVGQDILVEKTRRAIDFVRAAITERDAGADRPTTAADRQAAREQAAATSEEHHSSAHPCGPVDPR